MVAAVPSVVVVSARVDTADGRPAAQIDLIDVGGGGQVVTVDGVPEERVHPTSVVYHVRLLSPDRMLPDQLREAASWDEAVDVATRYAEKVADNTQKLADIAADLKV